MALRALIACSDAPYLARQEPNVGEDDIAAEPLCGWRGVQASAQYICKESNRKQKAPESPPSCREDQGISNVQQFPYMSGRMSDDFSYVYTSRPVESGPSKQQTWRQPNPSVLLEPVKPIKSTKETRALCRDFAKIVSLQLHQDIFLEQAWVQGQLQAASRDQVFPFGLEGVGLSVKPQFTRNSSSSNTSTGGTLHCSSLPEPMHKAKAKFQKTQRPLGWFPLGRAGHSGLLEYPQNLLVVTSQCSIAKNHAEKKVGKKNPTRK